MLLHLFNAKIQTKLKTVKALFNYYLNAGPSMAGGQGNIKLRFIKFHFNCSPWAEWRITHPGLGGIEVAPHNVCYSQVPIKRVGPNKRVGWMF